jgi:tetratricopeptide (TPR) repeat protein
MTLIPPRSLTSAPAVSPSLVPSDVPDAGLPFGKAPPKLVELETLAGGIPRELRRRIRALAENANQVRHRSPLTAAVCWNEAGRLLERKAGRTAESWICHSRALALFPDHKPALAALRRLARRAEDSETLRRVLVAEVERATNPVEQASMYTEIAVIDIRARRMASAMESLREAGRIWPDGLMADLLKLGVAAHEDLGEDLVATLNALAGRWPEPNTVLDIKMILALVEERLGRLDLAHKNLLAEADEVPISLAGLWARLRLCLRLDRPEEAAASIDLMIERIETPPMRRSLERFRMAIRILACEPEQSKKEAYIDAQSPVWDLELLDATRSGHRERVALAAKHLQATVQTPSIQEALAATEAACHWSPTGPIPQLSEDFDRASVIGRALISFLGLETEAKNASDTKEVEHDAYGAGCHVKSLVEAILHEDWQNILDLLSRVRTQTTEENDRWAIAIAEAAIQIQQQGRSKEAIDLLLSEGQQSDRRPLPILTRRYTNDETALAKLAIAEAEDSMDDEFKAFRLGWAASHFEESDKEQSEQLYLRALELAPSAKFAIAGLERLGAGHPALAGAYLSAAESVEDQTDRARYQVRAGLEYMFDKQGGQATALFSQAHKSRPDDRILAQTVLRLALSHPQDVWPEFVEKSNANENISGFELIALGSLGLAIDPEAAVHWFEKAALESPADPIVAAGLEMALLKSGRATVVSSGLLAKLQEAQTPEEEARAYQRISEIDRGYLEDAPAAVLSLLSLEEVLPGHQASLIQLIVHYLENDRVRELPNLLVALSRSLSDLNTRAALASAAWAADPSDANILKEIVGLEKPSILDLTEREGLTDDASEKIELLEKINERFVESPVHLSRLAESIGDSGDHVRAAEKYQEALVKRPDGIFELFEIARHLREMGDHSALKDTLIRLGDVAVVVDHRVEVLLEAAKLARDELDDISSAVELCLDVLAINPQNQEAYEMGRELLEESDNKRQHADLLGARLSIVQDEQIQREIHLELAGVLVELAEQDDKDNAKQFLIKALAVVPEDIDTERWLAQIYMEENEWKSAIEHLTAAAHLIRDEAEGCEVFFALGEIYMDHALDDDLAEKSFLKVLGWDNANFAAMERVGELYLRTRNYGRAQKAMEHLVRLAPDTSCKIEKMVGLANLMSQKLGAHAEAEKVLGEARRVDPYAFEPVEALTKIYQKQNDNLALNIHFDQAIASQASALRDGPDNLEIYTRIQKLTGLKQDLVLGSLAEEALAIVEGGASERRPRQQWRVGSRIADPSYNGYLCPKTVAAGLRETMRIVEEPLANLFGVSAKQLDPGRGARLDRRSQVAEILAELVNGFGLKEVNAFVDNKTSVRVAPGSPPAIIFPSSVVSSPDESVHRFAVASGLQMLRFGLSLATVLPLDRLRIIYAGIVRLSIPDYAPKGINAREVEKESSRIREVLNPRIFERIHPFAFDCTDAVNMEDTGQQILGVGYRAGLMGAGSLSGAVKGLRVALGKPEGSLGELPGAGQMMAFVFSRDHIELRRRLGI